MIIDNSENGSFRFSFVKSHMIGLPFSAPQCRKTTVTLNVSALASPSTSAKWKSVNLQFNYSFIVFVVVIVLSCFSISLYESVGQQRCVVDAAAINV